MSFATARERVTQLRESQDAEGDHASLVQSFGAALIHEVEAQQGRRGREAAVPSDVQRLRPANQRRMRRAADAS